MRSAPTWHGEEDRLHTRHEMQPYIGYLVCKCYEASPLPGFDQTIHDRREGLEKRCLYVV